MKVYLPGGTGGSVASLPSLGQVLTHATFADLGGDGVGAEGGAGLEGHGGLEEPTNYTGTAVWTETLAPSIAWLAVRRRRVGGR